MLTGTFIDEQKFKGGGVVSCRKVDQSNTDSALYARNEKGDIQNEIVYTGTLYK